MGDTFLRVTISRGARFVPSDKMMHIRSEHDKKSCLEDLNRQTLSTEVNLVAIHISFSALHKFFL
jgi:hypothetical protein